MPKNLERSRRVSLIGHWRNTCESDTLTLTMTSGSETIYGAANKRAITAISTRRAYQRFRAGDNDDGSNSWTAGGRARRRALVLLVLFDRRVNHVGRQTRP